MEGHVCPLLGVLTEKKIVQCESCELSFIWGTVRPRAWDTASQRALRSCPGKVGGEEVSRYMILEKGYVQPSTHLGRRLL